jgi:hypothetical protein
MYVEIFKSLLMVFIMVLVAGLQNENVVTNNSLFFVKLPQGMNS